MAVDQCSHCHKALEVLRLRESDEAEPLTRETAVIVVHYLTALVDHKGCRCLLKNADAYAAMHRLILDLIELASSLLGTLNDDLLIFAEMEGGSSAQPSGKRDIAFTSCVDESSLSCDGSESIDLEASASSMVPPVSGEVNGFTLDDRKDIFNLLAYLLTDQYLFYSLYYKYHVSVVDRRLTPDKEALAKKYFDVSGCSPLFILSLAAVKENGLLERLRQCFAEAKPGVFPPLIASKLIQTFTTLKRVANPQAIFSKIYPVRDAALKFVCELSDDQGDRLRDPHVRACAEQLWNCCREYLEEACIVDTNGLALILKHFNSPYLAPRMTALTQLNLYINVCNELLSGDHGLHSAEEAASAVAEYLSDHKVIQLLFGPNSHVELVKQCHSLLNFMALYEKISKEDLDCIWSAAQMKHCGRQVLDLLLLIIKGVDPLLLVYLYSLIKTLKPCEHNEMTLQLASCVTKMIWSYALCRSSPVTSMELAHSLSGVWSDRRSEHRPENRLSMKQQPLLSADSTQASTVGDASSSSDIAASPEDRVSKLEKSPAKDSPPSLVDPNEINKTGKHAELDEDRFERAFDFGEPAQKRARVVVEMASEPLKVQVEDLMAAIGVENNSPDESSTNESASNDNVGDVASNASTDHSMDDEHRQRVSRLMQHAKFPCAAVPASMVDDSGRGNVYGWTHAQESTSRLLETLVKHKELEKDRCYNESESDISSDAATSSDRLNELEDEDELVAAAAAVGDGDLVIAGHQSRLYHRQMRSSPVALEDEIDDDNGANGSLTIEPGLLLHSVSNTSPQPTASVSVTDQQSISYNRLAQMHMLHQHAQNQQALQFHHHQHQLLTQLAPHAKGFWQNRYQELSNAELELFDLSLVCEPGHSILWDLVVEVGGTEYEPPTMLPETEQQLVSTNGDRLPRELELIALQLLEEVVSWAPSIVIKKHVVRGCVERLQRHKSVPIVLKLLRKILASFRHTWRHTATTMAQLYRVNGGEETMPSNAVIWADTELDLLSAFFDDLRYFRQNQTTPTTADARYLVEQELIARIDFLEYVFSTQGTPNTCQITAEQLDSLWACLSTDDCGRELLYKWLLDQLKSQTQHALNMELLHYVLLSKVISFNAETLSSTGLAFLQAVLQESSAYSPNSQGEAAGVNVCLPLLWAVALRNVDTGVAMAAMTFISNYYVRTEGSAQKEAEFIDMCMSNLRFACQANTESQFTSSLMCIQRAIIILRSHIDAFRRRYAFYLRTWELEGRGCTPHMQNVSPTALIEAIPTYKVFIQAPGIPEKAVIEVSPSDLLGRLRANVIHWWKNTTQRNTVQISPRQHSGGVRTALACPNQRSGSSQQSDLYAKPGGSWRSARRRALAAAIRNNPTTSSESVSATSPVALPAESAAGRQTTIQSTPSSSSPESGVGFISLSGDAPRICDDIQGNHQNPILGALLLNSIAGGEQQHDQTTAGSQNLLRLLCGGRELTCDLDEKSIVEVGLRDSSTIHVQPSASASNGNNPNGRNGSTSSGTHHSPGQVRTSLKNGSSATATSLTSLPDLENIPMVLLSTPDNWELLMKLIKLLIDRASGGPAELVAKCRTWSYRAWEVVQLLPTYAPYMTDFQRLMKVDETNAAEIDAWLCRLFNSADLHYFLYSMQCLEMLEIYRDKFASLGGLQHLVKVLTNRSLFPKQSGDWSEWEVECLTSILRVLHNFSVIPGSSSSTPTWNGHRTKSDLSPAVQMLDKTKFIGVDLTKVRDTVLDLIDELCTERADARVCGHLSRAHCLQRAFQLLISLLVTDEDLRRTFRFRSVSSETGDAWLKKLLLDCRDPYLRREVSSNLYRLCRSKTGAGGWSCQVLTARLISDLLRFLADAVCVTPAVQEVDLNTSDSEHKSPHFQMANSLPWSADSSFVSPDSNSSMSEGKEPYGPSPVNYFWLLTNLLDSLLRSDNTKDSSFGSSHHADEDSGEETAIDFDAVTAKIAQYIIERPFYESKHASPSSQSGASRWSPRRQQQQTDQVSVGLLQTATAIMRFNPKWKFSHDGQNFVHAVVDLVFALPMLKNGRLHPKYQSSQSRTAAYDLLIEMAKGCEDNFMAVYKKLMRQNSKDSHDAYGWDYWPQDERRAACGYVGLMNLGATCYMASAMQQLYMIPRFRTALLSARVSESSKHEPAFREMQRMFAFLLESERKAYNPRPFCKAYQMNHQPLNITEQKDMAEFFTDLITKLEEMSPDLKRVVKNLFCGVMSNNVVSLDCPHVSKTVEDFYTVRCQVADMKDLSESLSELTVADMLEGDNMYTCSQCNKKVRAQKRACFQQLPRILCFNTMRYTFNMITMMKEKVNTHFSFPRRFNMAPFMEEYLLPSHVSGEETNDSMDLTTKSSVGGNEYELIGVTVHTGTAEGGHYYSFIRERTSPLSSPTQSSCETEESERWYSFNDAEVRYWDASQLAAECFGGELTRHQYDSAADKYLDFSFEKTNSAYMLFYERVPTPKVRGSSPDTKALSAEMSSKHPARQNLSKCQPDVPEDIERWICEDNMRFVQDTMFFDHAYFNYVWQMCSQVPATLLERDASEVTFLSAKLSLNFVLETLLHSKEKAMISQWMELLLKDLSASPRSCEWFLNRMAKNGDWPTEILIGCPSKSCREVFQKLCYHAILELHLKHEPLYLLPWTPDCYEKYDYFEPDAVGNQSCVGKFIKRLLNLLQTTNANVETRQLSEYFGLLLEFAKSRPAACTFLHLVSAISTLIGFYLKRSSKDAIDVESEEDMSDEELTGNLLSLVRTACYIRTSSSIWAPAVLERLLILITLLLDAARISGENSTFKLRQKDLQAVIGGKGYTFLMQAVRDMANPNISGPLILSVCRSNLTMGMKIIETIFDCLRKFKEDTEPYFSLLSYFIDIAERSTAGAVSGTGPSVSGANNEAMQNNHTIAMAYVNQILQRMWDLAETKNVHVLKWLERNVSNHRSIVFDSLIDNMKHWVERFLLTSANYQARFAAGELLLSLIPSPTVRTSFTAIGKGINLSLRPPISSEAASVLHRVYEHLLWLLRHKAASYAVPEHHSTHRLVTFFQVMKACLISKDEKLMVVQYVNDLWLLFHTHMMEKPVKINANKQALLTFWYMACVDCPELIQASVKNVGVQQYFMYNYIYVSDDDDELINSNKVMLHAFYGLMRLFCASSPSLCESVVRHENMAFACQSVATKDCYGEARNEIFGAIEICSKQLATSKPAVLAEFKERICTWFLTAVSKSRANFPLLLKFLKVVFDTPQDKTLLLQHHILPIISEAFCTLHKMHHEASGCNVIGDLSEILKRFSDILKFCTRCVSPSRLTSPAGTAVSAANPADESTDEQTKEIVSTAVKGEWSSLTAVLGYLLELLNSYIPPEVRKLSMDCIKEIVFLNEAESLATILPVINRVHTNCRETPTISSSMGPYFPKRGQTAVVTTPFRRIHPPRPMFHMYLQPTQLEASKYVDSQYDQMLTDYFFPYHHMVDRLLRIAFNLGPETVAPKLLIDISCLLGCEGVPLHFALFPKLWLDLWQRLHDGKDLQKQFDNLCRCFLLREYIEDVLIQEQSSLTNSQIFHFVQIFFDKCQPVSFERISNAIDNALTTITETASSLETIISGDQSSVAALREIERLPMSFFRTRGAFRALSLVYAPKKMPSDMYSGQVRTKVMATWKKFEVVWREKMLNFVATIEDDEDERMTDKSSNCQPADEFDGAKLVQSWQELLSDCKPYIDILRNRLDLPEMPSEDDSASAAASARPVDESAINKTN